MTKHDEDQVLSLVRLVKISTCHFSQIFHLEENTFDILL